MILKSLTDNNGGAIMHLTTVRNAQCFVAKTTKQLTSNKKLSLLQFFLKKNQNCKIGSVKQEEGEKLYIITILST